jgi:DNA-binding MarR family transcriptional regulator
MSSTRPGRPFLFNLLLQAQHQMVQELVRRLAAAGFADLRPAHSRVFENLDVRHGTRLIDLAERAQMTHQSMSELVASLEQRGYVERRPDPTDRRAKIVCFTPRGRQMMRMAVPAITAIEEEWLRRLDRGCDGDLRTALREAVRATEGSPEDGTKVNAEQWPPECGPMLRK